ncbi:type 1 periplasmic binding fold superfamily protein [Wenyingzhuangia sp. IMCC45467]
MKLKKLMMVMLVGLLLTSCKKDDPIIPNEEEVITTLKYTLSPVLGGDDVVFIYKDINGNGTSIDVTEGVLTKDTEYTGALTLLNETEDPAEDITLEVKKEGVDHQFFFTVPEGLTINYTDTDENNNPVGLETSIVTSATFAGGNLTIVLRHEPNKSAEGVKNGEIANAGGETDIEVTFNVDVQD